MDMGFVFMGVGFFIGFVVGAVVVGCTIAFAPQPKKKQPGRAWWEIK